MSKIEINKNTRGLRVVGAEAVYRRTRQGLRIIDPTHVYGRIERKYPHIILNRSNNCRTYKDDFANLSTRVKSDVVDQFNNYGRHSRRVLYLVDSQFNLPRQNNRRRAPRNNNRNNNRYRGKR